MSDKEFKNNYAYNAEKILEIIKESRQKEGKREETEKEITKEEEEKC